MPQLLREKARTAYVRLGFLLFFRSAFFLSVSDYYARLKGIFCADNFRMGRL
jgi:hypothetical protein